VNYSKEQAVQKGRVLERLGPGDGGGCGPGRCL